MRYFIYVSETKVGMLFPQIPKKFLAGLSGELKVSLGIADVTLKSGSEPTDDVFSRSLAIEHYLDSKKLLGSPFEHNEYFRGTHPLSYGVLYDYASDIAIFGTRLGSLWLVMIGARSSLVGETKAVDTSQRSDLHALNYYELRSLNGLLHKEGFNDEERHGGGSLHIDTAEAMKIGLAALPTSDTHLHYVAKSLKKIQTADGLFVLASPIYVSYPPATTA